ncbi:MAG TPA: AMP-binding protein [Thermoanaerobaculia bacterium]|nr:AMP-binding protein [Thermoanaerobaculia bacterium]
MAESLVDWLRRAAAVPAAGLRLVDRRERERMLTWAEVAAAAERVAGGLQALGVRPGERVGLVYPTGEEFFAAFFGALRAGAVPVPLPPPLRLGALAAWRGAAASRLRGVAAALALTERRLRRPVSEAAAAATTPGGARTLDGLPAAAALPVAVDGADLALVQLTSGTTGEPRGVALTHAALMAQARILNGFWPDGAGAAHTGVSWLPLYHDMGLVGGVLTALERPATLTLLPPEGFIARPALWLRAISRARATVSAAPDFAYRLCVEQVRDDELAGVDLSCWRVALDGAEPVSAAVLGAFARRFARWGFRREALTPVYGLAEAGLAVTFGELEAPFTARRFAADPLASRGEAVEAPAGRELVALGRPVPGFAVEVRDRAAGRLPEGRVGRVWARGPSLMQGYLDRPAETARVLRDGWLDTGDLGFLYRGDLYLVGRAREVIVVRGRNLAPAEVEEPVAAVPGVRRGGVAAMGWSSGDGLGEALVVLLEADEEVAPARLPELAAAAREAALAAAGVAPRRVAVVAARALPRTSSGKLRRGAALRALLAGDLTVLAELGVDGGGGGSGA